MNDNNIYDLIAIVQSDDLQRDEAIIIAETIQLLFAEEAAVCILALAVRFAHDEEVVKAAVNAFRFIAPQQLKAIAYLLDKLDLSEHKKLLWHVDSQA